MFYLLTNFYNQNTLDVRIFYANLNRVPPTKLCQYPTDRQTLPYPLKIMGIVKPTGKYYTDRDKYM